MLNRLTFSLALLLVTGHALAEDKVEPYEEYGKRLRAAQEVTPLKNDAFGDEVSLYNGATTFNNVDISIPAGSQLPVELRRRLEVQDRKKASGDNVRGFSEWDIDVPYITGTFESNTGWKVDTVNGYDRCTSPGKPVTNVEGIKFGYVDKIWDGNHLHIPGSGDQEMLKDAVDTIPDMEASTGAHPWLTKDFFRIGCGINVKNPTVTPGEGFVAVSPQGVKYFFDWAIERAAPKVYTYSSAGVQGSMSHYAFRKHVMLLATRVEDRFGHGINYTYSGDKLTRIQADDGRYVQLTYSVDGTRIVQADSTVGTWTYAYVQRPMVTNAQGFTIDPGSVDPNSYSLSGVTQPDGSTWSYSYTGSLKTMKDQEEPITLPPQLCQAAKEPYPNYGNFDLTVTAPWGATATYDFEYVRHYRNYIPLSCPDGNRRHLWPETYAFFDNWTLTDKQITGPGLSPTTWTYSYGGPTDPSNYYESPIDGPWTSAYANATYITPAMPSADFDVSKAVTVTQCEGALIGRLASCTTGAGNVNVYSFGVQFSRNEGQLLSTSVRELNGTERKRTTNTYIAEADMASQPFPRNAGTTLLEVVKNPMVNRLRPTRDVSIAQDVTDFALPNFTTHNNTFDVFATPVSVTKTGVGTNSTCTEATTFEHNLVKWVTGQVKTRSGCDIPVQTDYDPTTALPTRKYSGNVLQSTLAYYATNDTDNLNGNDHQVGDLMSITDGNGKVTTLDDYYLGLPRKVGFPTGFGESATVNAKGYITSVTDENGYTTGYGYDAMGRVNLVTPPAGDSVAWAATSVSFAQVPSSTEYGVGPGHWKRTLSKGNYRNVTVYDAMWRPVVSKEWDNTSSATIAATQRYSRFDYDADSRKLFAAYPSNVDPDVSPSQPKPPGVTMTYDALGRTLTSSAYDEDPVTHAPTFLVTRNTYLAGFKTRVTNPRQYSTETTFFARGEPSTSSPVQIKGPYLPNMTPAPELQTTDILRSITGQTTSVTRSGTYAGVGVSATRSYVYDTNFRLCLRIEPETGTTVVDYDLAGNVSWSANGQTVTGCANRATLASSIPATEKTTRTYDALNRIKSVDVPNSTNDPTYVYFPDGALQKLTSGTAIWDYTYNRLRLPVSEKLTYGGKVRTLTHGYNAYGNENSQTYPDGLVVAINPDALGNATQAGSYATGTTYFPNGGMSGFTYGNGIVHSMVQNARQVPDRSLDQKPGQAAVLDDSYDYDFNGNVAAITDGVIGGGGNRTMSYDGLDRLTNVDAPNMWWLNSQAMYDPLDNIRRNKVGTRTYNYVYDANNRLSQLKDYNTGAVVRTIATDVRGNITGNGVQTLSFDYANRLTDAVGKENYAYDGHGRRVWINRTSDNKASFPMYSLAGQLVTEDDNRSNQTTDYVYLSGSLVAKRYATIGTSTWTTRYIHTDALGSPVAESDTAAPVPTVVRIEKYTPYGEPNDGSYDQGPGFTGHVTDAATGYSYMQQRYYDPVIGRFLSQDPKDADTDYADNFNRYFYAKNNPYLFRDPDGRDWDELLDTITQKLANALTGASQSESPTVQATAGLAANAMKREVNSGLAAAQAAPGNAAQAMKTGAVDAAQAVSDAVPKDRHELAESLDHLSENASRAEVTCAIVPGWQEGAPVAGGVSVASAWGAELAEPSDKRFYQASYKTATLGVGGALARDGLHTQERVLTVVGNAYEEHAFAEEGGE